MMQIHDEKPVNSARRTNRFINDPGITYNEPGVTYNDSRYSYGGAAGSSDRQSAPQMVVQKTPSSHLTALTTVAQLFFEKPPGRAVATNAEVVDPGITYNQVGITYNQA